MFEIIVNDWDALDRYFVGKKPRTKEAFVEGVKTKSSFVDMAYKHGLIETTLYTHSRNLQKLGVISKRRYTPPVTDQDIIYQQKKDLRKTVRNLIMLADAVVLQNVVDLLSKEARVNE